ncbi:MAG: hypothetical protein LDL41_25365 [Coleofasciculus sp. S288]|nr:hypothetical protein [Coleofasciculus sp. S288]
MAASSGQQALRGKQETIQPQNAGELISHPLTLETTITIVSQTSRSNCSICFLHYKMLNNINPFIPCSARVKEGKERTKLMKPFLGFVSLASDLAGYTNKPTKIGTGT